MRVFIGMGSNLGDGPRNLLQAWKQLGGDPDIRCVALSSPYVTAPVDMQSQHWFTNCVGELRTTLTAEQLLVRLLEIEKLLGRVREEQVFGYQDRVIDIDLLYYGELQTDEPNLILPHPHLLDRLFVLSPLTEIAPDFMDCKRRETVRELEAELRRKIDRREVRHQEINRGEWPEVD